MVLQVDASHQAKGKQSANGIRFPLKGYINVYSGSWLLPGVKVGLMSTGFPGIGSFLTFSVKVAVFVDVKQEGTRDRSLA